MTTRHTSRPGRLTRADILRLRRQLAERDGEVLSLLERVTVATARQVETVLFTSATPLSNARQSRKSLGRLEVVGLVQRLRGRRGGVRAGSAGDVFALTSGGYRVLDPERLPRRTGWPVSRAFLDHALARTDLYIGLVAGERAGLGELLSFAAEPAAWRRYTGSGGETLVLKPDAHLVTRSGGF